MRLLNKIILGILTRGKGDKEWTGQTGGMTGIQTLLSVAVVSCFFAFFPSSLLAQPETVYVGNNLSASGSGDTLPPLVILGEYAPTSPSDLTTAALPTGTVQDVKFYGQNYAFTLYAFAWVSNGPYASEATFKVIASEGFTNNSVGSAGTNTLIATNFTVNAGDFLAFVGKGPYYLQPATTNGLDATYATNSTGYTASSPGGSGTTFILGINGDTNANYQYIPSTGPTLPSRTYAIGADILTTNGYTFAAIAGQTTNGYADGLGTSALFNNAQGTAVASNFDVFVADTDNNDIRKIATLQTNWLTITIAGSSSNYIGSLDGPGTNAFFDHPEGIAVTSNELVFVSDTFNNTIRMIVPSNNNNWFVSTIAGMAGSIGSSDGSNSTARFDMPEGLAVDINTNIYVTDATNDTIRKITLVNTNWVVTTIAGMAGFGTNIDGTNTQARFKYPGGIAVDHSGNLYVADSGDNTIRKITPIGTNWVVTTIVGSYTNLPGSADGTNAAARFDSPGGIAVDASNNLYVTDTANDTIRKVVPSGTNWIVSTIGGVPTNPGFANGTGPVARFTNPKGISVNSVGNLFVDEPEVTEGGNVDFQVQNAVASGGKEYWVEVVLAPQSAINAGAQWLVESLNPPSGEQNVATYINANQSWTSSGSSEGALGKPITLSFSAGPGWNSPNGSGSGGASYVPGSSTTLMINNLAYTSAPPVLYIINENRITNGLWISGALDATYEIDWTNRLTNGMSGPWPPWSQYGTPAGPGTIQLNSGTTQQVTNLLGLMEADMTSNPAFYRAKWTGQ